MTAEAPEPWELARSTLCLGCAAERPRPGSEKGAGSLWCRGCWRTFFRTGELPDLLRGGEALRGG